MRDFANDVSAVQSIRPSSKSATTTGEIVDLKDFSKALALVQVEGSKVFSSTNKWTLTFEHGDAATLSDAAQVDDSELLGSIVVAGTDTASLTTALTGTNNDLVFTAVATGTAGNAITVAYVDPSGNDQALAVTVTDSAISVSLATNGSGTITSTAASIKTAIEEDEAASALVTVANAAANDGTGVVTALTATNLTGGSDAQTITADSNGAFVLNAPVEAEGAIGEISYLGNKRYLRAKLTKGASAPNTVFAVPIIRSGAKRLPV